MSEGAIYWYVLFVRSGSEEKVTELLKNSLDSQSYSPFIPKKTCIFRRQGKKSTFQKICFPGYVFIESDKAIVDFIRQIFPVVYKIKDVYRFLSYGDRYDIAMQENERVALRKVLGIDHCIDISTGFKEGDSVRIVSGSLLGHESQILRINKNRKEAIVAMEMFGTIVETSVGLEVIERV